MGDLGMQVSVCPSIRLSVNIYPGCLVSATPPTVLTDHFEILHMFSTWYEDVHVIWIKLLDYILSLFPHCKLNYFSPFICKQLVPLVSATPLTVLYGLL